MSALRDAVRHTQEAFRTSGFLWTASLILDRIGLPAIRFWQPNSVSKQALAAQVGSILHGWGMSDEHVSITTEKVLYADLHGIDSHGCAMLVDYHRYLLAGKLKMDAKIEVVRDSATTALIDGGGGLGHVPGDMAMKLAIEKCRISGIGAVAARNSGHYGAAGAYASMATQAGFIGLATTNTRTPSVVPTFGVEAMFGTNPIALAAPTKKNRPFLLDMATSTAPVGKLMTAWRRGRSIPVGWAIDPQGWPVTNPRKAAKYRRLTPLGSSSVMSSHKGYGLAAAVEIMSSILPGLRATEGEHPRVGHFFLALNPQMFREAGQFEADMDSMIDALHACKPINAEQPVLVAGDPEYAANEERSKNCIPLSRSTFEDIRMICRAGGMPFVLENASGSTAAR